MTTQTATQHSEGDLNYRDGWVVWRGSMWIPLDASQYPEDQALWKVLKVYYSKMVPAAGTYQDKNGNWRQQLGKKQDTARDPYIYEDLDGNWFVASGATPDPSTDTPLPTDQAPMQQWYRQTGTAPLATDPAVDQNTIVGIINSAQSYQQSQGTVKGYTDPQTADLAGQAQYGAGNYAVYPLPDKSYGVAQIQAQTQQPGWATPDEARNNLYAQLQSSGGQYSPYVTNYDVLQDPQTHRWYYQEKTAAATGGAWSSPGDVQAALVTAGLDPNNYDIIPSGQGAYTYQQKQSQALSQPNFTTDQYGNVWYQSTADGAWQMMPQTTMEQKFRDSIFTDYENGNIASAQAKQDFLNQPTSLNLADFAMQAASSPADYMTIWAIARGQQPIEQNGPFGRIAPYAQFFQDALNRLFQYTSSAGISSTDVMAGASGQAGPQGNVATQPWSSIPTFHGMPPPPTSAPTSTTGGTAQEGVSTPAPVTGTIPPTTEQPSGAQAGRNPFNPYPSTPGVEPNSAAATGQAFAQSPTYEQQTGSVAGQFAPGQPQFTPSQVDSWLASNYGPQNMAAPAGYHWYNDPQSGWGLVKGAVGNTAGTATQAAGTVPFSGTTSSQATPFAGSTAMQMPQFLQDQFAGKTVQPVSYQWSNVVPFASPQSIQNMTPTEQAARLPAIQTLTGIPAADYAAQEARATRPTGQNYFRSRVTTPFASVGRA